MIYLGADHGGFSFKEKIKEFLKELKIEYQDLGNTKFEPEDDFVDYAVAVAKKVVETNGKGILVCTNGEGMCIAANKIKGIRAVSPSTKKSSNKVQRRFGRKCFMFGRTRSFFSRGEKNY